MRSRSLSLSRTAAAPAVGRGTAGAVVGVAHAYTRDEFMEAAHSRWQDRYGSECGETGTSFFSQIYDDALAEDLEQVAAAAGTPVKKPVEDEVLDVDALKAENEALKAKLAEAEAKAAAAIDA